MVNREKYLIYINFMYILRIFIDIFSYVSSGIDQAKSNKPSQGKPSQTKPKQTKPRKGKPSQAKPNQTKPN